METSIRFCVRSLPLVTSRPKFIHDKLAVRLCPPLIFHFNNISHIFNKGSVTLICCFHPVGLKWRNTAAEFRCTYW